jgi:hypothetical protein
MVASSSSDFARKLARAKVEEQKCAAYLKALGYRVLPTTEFSASGAPKLEAENENESIVMPDLQAFRDGAGAWFECKWKHKADESRRHAGRLVTGVGLRHYDHYCRIERETRTPVVIVFIHETEQEVRCATLNQLEQAFSHDYHGDKMDRSGMRFWVYERVPLWMPLAELRSAMEAQRYSARLVEPPIEPPINNELLRQSHAVRRHGAGREANGPGPLAPQPWTWTCLPCNATGVGDAAKHRCSDAADWRRDFWIQRLRWAMPAASKDELASFVDKPIARTRLIEILGPQWAAERDAR